MVTKLDKLFHLSENNTTIRTEIIAGLTTFITGAYVVQVIPSIAAQGDSQLFQAMFVGTILATIFGTLIMAFGANKPFLLAPGLGTAVYFVLVTNEISNKSDLPYAEALSGSLTLVLTSGILFTLLSALGIREKIIEAIPEFVRVGLGAAIGMMLIQIGL
ncbi:MAG: NCS2 family permease, partial [Clostridia bacterium]|nr:NCS2 family permease [Clostridia bacterium]